jgi:plastocyanin
VNSAELRRLVLSATAGLVGATSAVAVAFALEVQSDGSSGPTVGDHWHAPYAIFVGDEQQPRIAETITPQGIHTHGDGVIHIHPHVTAGEGNGANLGNFFGDQGGKLTNNEMQIPGRQETYNSGEDIDENGIPEELRILRASLGRALPAEFNEATVDCNAKPESDFEPVDSRYVARDGDCIRIIFAEPGSQSDVRADRTILAADQAEREIAMTVTGSGGTTVFTPSSLDVSAGEIVEVTLTNNSREAAFHGLRFSGPDRIYGNNDDFVLPNIDPGATDSVVIRYETPGEYEFRSEQAIEGVTPVTGTVIVGEPAS